MLPLAIAKMGTLEKVGKAKEALARVGLAAKVDRLPNQLSGGEQERLPSPGQSSTIRTSFLPMNRPGTLDSKTSDEVMALFRQLNENGQTVVMVTHNPHNCGYSDRTVVLRDGQVVEG